MDNRRVGYVVLGASVVLCIIIVLSSVFSAFDKKELELQAALETNRELSSSLDSLSLAHSELEVEYGDLLGSYEIAQRLNEDLIDEKVAQDQWLAHVHYYRVYCTSHVEYFWQYSDYETLHYWKMRERDVSEYYKAPLDTDVLNTFITHDNDNTLVGRIANVLHSGIGDREYAEVALDFVHNAIYYMSDYDSTGSEDYWRYPDEALFDKVGDCEDTSFLYASLLRAADIPCVLIEFDAHMGVGVGIDAFDGNYFEFEGKNYYYAETTSNKFDEDPMSGKDYQIGEYPDILGCSAIMHVVL